MPLPVVDDAPRIASIGVAALKLPCIGTTAERFKPIDLRALVVSQVRAWGRSQSCHTAVT